MEFCRQRLNSLLIETSACGRLASLEANSADVHCVAAISREVSK